MPRLRVQGSGPLRWQDFSVGPLLFHWYRAPRGTHLLVSTPTFDERGEEPVSHRDRGVGPRNDKNSFPPIAIALNVGGERNLHRWASGRTELFYPRQWRSTSLEQFM